LATLFQGTLKPIDTSVVTPSPKKIVFFGGGEGGVLLLGQKVFKIKRGEMTEYSGFRIPFCLLHATNEITQAFTKRAYLFSLRSQIPQKARIYLFIYLFSSFR
jgi:hypothetical protein